MDVSFFDTEMKINRWQNRRFATVVQNTECAYFVFFIQLERLIFLFPEYG